MYWAVVQESSLAALTPFKHNYSGSNLPVFAQNFLFIKCSHVLSCRPRIKSCGPNAFQSQILRLKFISFCAKFSVH